MELHLKFHLTLKIDEAKKVFNEAKDKLTDEVKDEK